MDEVKRQHHQTEAVDIEVGENVPCLNAQRPVVKALDALIWVVTCSFSSDRHSTSLPAASLSKDILSLELQVNAKGNGSFTDSYIFQERRTPVEHKHKSKWPEKGRKHEYISRKNHGLLIAATLLAATTFHATLRSPVIFSHDDLMNHLFILFNSLAFFASVTLITLLTYHLPMKPWLWIVLLSTIGDYICAVTVVSPGGLGTVVFVGNCVLLAALFIVLPGSRIF